jgi:methylthioribose-1-phosphate isomerase
MESMAERLPDSKLYSGLLAEAHRYWKDDIAFNRRMGRYGASLLKKGSSVITYCNAGALATGGIGTALGVIFEARRQGKIRHVYACETRPYLQGSRLTLWELMQAKVPATLITDNMASHIMATEKIDAVIVGSDRIAANADVANKIGTYGLAISAKRHGVPFYVAAPSTTVDLSIPHGRRIPIEERGSAEVLFIGPKAIAPKNARARHPAFDVTPHDLVSAIVTEKGVVRPATAARLKKVMAS